MEKLITSLQNPKLKQVLRLRERRERDETKTFLIEGYREVLRAGEASYPLKELFFCPELFLGENEEKLLSKLEAAGVALIRCDEKVFRKLSYRDRPDGLVALAQQIPRPLKDLDLCFEKETKPLFVVAQAIEKPGNLGTILRTADAVAADAVIVVDACTDIYNPNVVRASIGTLFTRKLVLAKTEDLLPYLKQKGVKILAMAPDSEKNYTDVELKEAVAIVLGCEQLGLTSEWLSEADYKVRLPMLGVADSLNVAMAAGVMLYEVLRQRS